VELERLTVLFWGQHPLGGDRDFFNQIPVLLSAYAWTDNDNHRLISPRGLTVDGTNNTNSLYFGLV
jgi:hypothetical protein